jgi:hypothetical protein
VAWPVYSERFLYAITYVAGSRVYLVPDDMRAIITHISMVNEGANAGSVLLRGHGIKLYRRDVPASPSNETFVLRAVVYQGETIDLYTSGAGLQASVYGYLLTDSSGRDGPPAAAADYQRFIPDAPDQQPG